MGWMPHQTWDWETVIDVTKLLHIIIITSKHQQQHQLHRPHIRTTLDRRTVAA